MEKDEGPEAEALPRLLDENHETGQIQSKGPSGER